MCRIARAQIEPGKPLVLDDYPVAELREYIDWQPFFNAWEMKGAFPDILNNPSSGPAARKLYDDAQEMLDRMVEEARTEQGDVLERLADDPAAAAEDMQNRPL